jgi:hypothetical protein
VVTIGGGVEIGTFGFKVVGTGVVIGEGIVTGSGGVTTGDGVIIGANVGAGTTIGLGIDVGNGTSTGTVDGTDIGIGVNTGTDGRIIAGILLVGVDVIDDGIGGLFAVGAMVGIKGTMFITPHKTPFPCKSYITRARWSFSSLVSPLPKYISMIELLNPAESDAYVTVVNGSPFVDCIFAELKKGGPICWQESP